MFAWAVGFVATVDSGPYFTNGQDASGGDTVYFSFTVLTTTGFGDYPAATPAGHTLAVVEMLVGQLYLVTVIGVLVGGLVRRSAGEGTARLVGRLWGRCGRLGRSRCERSGSSCASRRAGVPAHARVGGHRPTEPPNGSRLGGQVRLTDERTNVTRRRGTAPLPPYSAT